MDGGHALPDVGGEGYTTGGNASPCVEAGSAIGVVDVTVSKREKGTTSFFGKDKRPRISANGWLPGSCGTLRKVFDEETGNVLHTCLYVKIRGEVPGGLGPGFKFSSESIEGGLVG